MVRPRMPMPLRPAISQDCGLVAAIQMGGCGFWSGLGRMLRGGTVTNRPACSNGSSVHMRGIISSDSCHISRERSVSTSRSEEHTSELQSHHDLVCRLLLEKKKKKKSHKNLYSYA